MYFASTMYEIFFLMNITRILKNEAWLLHLTRIFKYILNLIPSLIIIVTIIMRQLVTRGLFLSHFFTTCKDIYRMLQSFTTATFFISRESQPCFRSGFRREFLNKARRCHSTRQDRFRWNRLAPWVCRSFDQQDTVARLNGGTTKRERRIDTSKFCG